MDTQKAQRIIIISTALVIVISTVNSIGKNKSWPGAKFWLGSGFMAVSLSALAEWEPEIAGPLSLAVLTTVILGEGDGLLSYISTRGEIDTQKHKPTSAPASTGTVAASPTLYPARTNVPGTTVTFA